MNFLWFAMDFIGARISIPNLSIPSTLVRGRTVEIGMREPMRKIREVAQI